MNNNLVIRLKKLRKRRAKLDKLEELATNSYRRHKWDYRTLFELIPWRRCTENHYTLEQHIKFEHLRIPWCTEDHLELVQHIMYCIHKNENLHRRRDIRNYHLFRARDHLERLDDLFKPAVHYAVVDTLNALFDEKQIVVPHIVDHIAAHTKKLNEELVEKRYREWNMK